MKKVVWALLCFFVISHYAMAYSAESMIALDISSGRVLYEQNSYEEKLIASTTKIMTTIVAIEQMNLDTEITVDERVLKAYGSGIYIEMGEVMTLRDLLYGLMLRSGNDAAIVIACGVSGSMEAFVSLMNQKAYELGMSHTKFYNSHGLEENDGKGNTSTAYDMALLMRYAMKNLEFQTITGTKNYVGKSDKKTYHWTNKNKLLRTYEYTVGGKTGFTEKARRTLVTAARKDGKEITIVTLNDGNDFNDHKNLYEALFSKFEKVVVLKKNELDTSKCETYLSDQLYLEKDVELLATKDEIEKIHVEYEINSLDTYKTGDQVGVVKVFLDEKELLSSRVYVRKKEDTPKEGIFQKFFGWLFGW